MDETGPVLPHTPLRAAWRTEIAHGKSLHQHRVVSQKIPANLSLRARDVTAQGHIRKIVREVVCLLLCSCSGQTKVWRNRTCSRNAALRKQGTTLAEDNKSELTDRSTGRGEFLSR